MFLNGAAASLKQHLLNLVIAVFKMDNTDVYCNFSSFLYFCFCQVVQSLFTCQQEGTAHTLPQQQLTQSFLEAFLDLTEELCNNSKAANAFHSLLMIDGHFKHYSGINIVK